MTLVTETTTIEEEKLPRWMDGPKLVEWLDEVFGLPVRNYDETDGRWTANEQRRLLEWKNPGTLADVYTVDRMLVRLGLALVEVPDEVYVPGNRHYHRSRR